MAVSHLLIALLVSRLCLLSAGDRLNWWRSLNSEANGAIIGPPLGLL